MQPYASPYKPSEPSRRCAPGRPAGRLLQAMYQAWGNRPAAWTTGLQLGLPLCGWDPYNHNSETGSIECNPTNTRVQGLCVCPPLNHQHAGAGRVRWPPSQPLSQ